ncbi:MAG: S8 family serine peptidase [bacterium]|nr:S8 family serine peptidase [bacterium]
MSSKQAPPSPPPGAGQPIGEIDGALVFKTVERPDGQDYFYVDRELVIRTDQLREAAATVDLIVLEGASPIPGSDYSTVPVDSRRHPVPELIDTLREAGLDANPHHVLMLSNHTQFGPHDAPEPIEPGPEIDAATATLTAASAKGGKVVVIDTGVLPRKLTRDIHDSNGLIYAEPEQPGNLAGKKIAPHIGHGTFVAGKVLIDNPDARVYVFRPRALNSTNEGDSVFLDDKDLAIVLARALAHMAELKVKGKIGFDDALTVAEEAASRFEEYDLEIPRALNLSLAGPSHTPDDMNPLKKTRPVLSVWVKLGVKVVAAAGNAHRNDPFYPAAYDDVVGVGATDEHGQIAGFSNSGPWVNVYTNGVDILSCYLDGGDARSYVEVPMYSRRRTTKGKWHGYARWSGTSFATPAIAAMYA